MKRLKNAKREKNPVARAAFRKRFSAGGYFLAAVAVVIAIAVAANLVVSALPSESTQLDLTAQSLFTLSDQTRRVAAALDRDVTLYLLANRGGEDETVRTLLDRYAGLSDRITIELVDPTEQPTFLDRYELEISRLYANSVLVVSGSKSRLVGYDEIFVTSYSMDGYGYTTSTSFEGENALTNAIHYVSRDDLPKVYTLVGHGETELPDSITQLIERDNLQTENLSLLMIDSVPEDASAVVIHVPTGDLSADEADMLIAYLERGGSVVLMTDYIAQGQMENLLRVTSAMGLTAGQGIVVEGDRNKHLSRYPYYLLPDIAGHEVTDPLAEGGYYALVSLAQPILTLDGMDASVTQLLTTSSEAYSKPAALEMTTTDKEDGDIDGPFAVMAASEKGEGKMIWATTAELLSDRLNALVSGANSDLFMNALSWMCGQEETISIRAKSMDSSTLTLNGAQSTFWSAVLIGVLPGLLLIAGAVVTIRRKRR